MNSHKHARLTPAGRALLVQRVLHEGWSMAAATQAMGVSCRTCFKWLARFRAEGAAGLRDPSSRPHHSPAACCAEQVGQFELHRRQCLPLWRIARQYGRGLATVAWPPWPGTWPAWA
jgi:transposase